MRHLALVPFLLALALPGAARAQDPQQVVVESFHDVLLSSMKEADALGFEGRFYRMAQGLDRYFDLPFMARLALGATWKALTPTQQAEFVALSRRFSAASYAKNFASFGGQRFETLGAEPAARGTTLVKTEMLQPGEKTVRFDYRLRKAQDGWRIIDVHLDGMISELTIRRSEYRSLIQREGFAGLVETLEQKIREYAAAD